MIQNRKLYILLCGGAAWSSTVTETVLSVLEVLSLSTSQKSLISITTSASTLNGLSICCIAFYAFQKARRIKDTKKPSTRSGKFLEGSCIVVSATALLVSLISIIMIKVAWQDVVSTSSSGSNLRWTSLISGHIAMWIISCLTQCLLYISTFLFKDVPEAQTVSSSGPRDSVMSECRPTRPTTLCTMEAAQPVAPLGALPSPTFSNRSSQSLRSFRDSIRHVIRPVTSRTNLISRPSFTRDSRSIYSDRQSIDTVSHTDGFDSWDTSSVSLQARDVVMQAVPSRGTALEPIPGSRPNSPARALDGPFLSDLPEEDVEELTPPPRMVPDVSRPPSPAVSEAHIHPLFRSESPVPPMATPGTNILASPLANQAITCPTRPFNRMRSSSRASQTTTQSPLVHTKSFTRDQSMHLPTRSRSSSPPSRQMTPPIPDFVLNSSPRSSMSGSRKVHLQHSPDR